MNRKVAAVIIALTAVFVISGTMAFAEMKSGQKRYAEVISDGRVIYTFDLPETDNQTLTVKSPDGKSSNTICIDNGKIRVSDAGCPDKVCVKSGILKSEGMPVVCLPNKLIVRFCEGK